MTLHIAFRPQIFSHGFLHLFCIHAKLVAQSELTTHSGRQPSYGFPMWSCWQTHAPAFPCSLHIALGPHGEGEHGVRGTSMTLHAIKASPVNPLGHKHWGAWLTTRHSAPDPHDPGQGSLHFWLMHAISFGHSVFAIHSGRQFGGLPRKFSRQAHDGEFPISLQIELAPQGEGWQGLTYGGGIGSKTIIFG